MHAHLSDTKYYIKIFPLYSYVVTYTKYYKYQQVPGLGYGT